MRKAYPVLAMLALVACSPEVPDSAAGVGFGSYDNYAAQRERALASEMTVRAPQQAGVPSADALSEAFPLPASGETRGAEADPLTAVIDVNNPGISDEQSFDAVASRETIQSDRERLEAQRQQYTFIEPEPLPPRQGGVGPNIVQYALSTTNAPGEARYRRGGLTGMSRFQKACAKYPSSDLAQQAFLSAGGPERDKLGLDPDGDGFACYWDPTPFRAAVN
ncbi:hypothetical protein EV663_101212 [Rhodovulum bhavnagarense]|uniref:Excalibur calcium-binding domain-containing protein n=1 Tax=Rhodovulum bhavnagarense TaxID=992286 RepID=A0A4R2RGY7_9RHOB|nr:hypothetical protein [Rhodovulum bhavnagarense]TCP62950.1 hypothetical protein EV663_101212 [Rhodovulum bhavnagarense]